MTCADPRHAKYEQAEAEAEKLRRCLAAGSHDAIEIRLAQLLRQRHEIEKEMRRLAHFAEGAGRLDLVSLIFGYMDEPPTD